MKSSRPASRPASRGRAPAKKKGAGSTLLGIFIGLLLGLGLAVAVAFFLNRGSPWRNEPTKSSMNLQPPANTSLQNTKATPAGGNKPAAATKEEDKPRFDFYRILPGVSEPKPQPKPVEPPTETAAPPQPQQQAKVADVPKPIVLPDAPKPADPSKPRERLFLQAGAFQSAGDAEDLKAKLAFAGMEASIQPISLPDKGTLYRVRLGPYDNTDELSKIKSDLAKRGYSTAVVKP